MRNDRPRFSPTLEAQSDEPDEPSAARRLARGLKYLLRACWLKCTEVREIALPCPMPPDGQSTDPAARRGNGPQ